MIYRESDFTVSVRSNLKAGRGDVTVTEYVPKENMTNCRLICEQVIPVGGSIGKHIHKNETEFYLIREGSGLVIEKEGEYSVKPGDVVVTGHGEMHSIENTGQTNLIMTAIIVTH